MGHRGVTCESKFMYRSKKDTSPSLDPSSAAANATELNKRGGFPCCGHSPHARLLFRAARCGIITRWSTHYLRLAPTISRVVRRVLYLKRVDTSDACTCSYMSETGVATVNARAHPALELLGVKASIATARRHMIYVQAFNPMCPPSLCSDFWVSNGANGYIGS